MQVRVAARRMCVCGRVAVGVGGVGVRGGREAAAAWREAEPSAPTVRQAGPAHAAQCRAGTGTPLGMHAGRSWAQHAHSNKPRQNRGADSPRVLGVHRHRGIAQHRLRASGGHHNLACRSHPRGGREVRKRWREGWGGVCARLDELASATQVSHPPEPSSSGLAKGIRGLVLHSHTPRPTL